MLNKKSKKILFYTLITVGFGFIQSLLVIRTLDLTDFGKVTIVLAFILFLQNIIGIRTGEFILKYIPNIENKMQVFPTILKIMLIDLKISIALLLTVLLLGYGFGSIFNLDQKILFILSFIILFSTSFMIFESVFVILNNMILQFKIKAAYSFISLIVVSSLTYIYGLEGYLIALLLTRLGKTVVYGIYATKELINNSIPLQLKEDAVKLENVWNFSKHSFISSTFKSGIGGMDVLLLSIALQPSQIAIYSVAKKAAVIPGTFLGSLWKSIQPQILEYSRKQDFNKLFQQINKFTMLFAGILLIIIFPLITFSGDLLIFLYGQKYEPSTGIFIIFFIGYWLANTFAPYSRTYYLAQNKMHMMTYLNGFVFFNILIFGYIFKDSIRIMSLITTASLVCTSLFVYIEILRKRINK